MPYHKSIQVIQLANEKCPPTPNDYLDKPIADPFRFSATEMRYIAGLMLPDSDSLVARLRRRSKRTLSRKERIQLRSALLKVLTKNINRKFNLDKNWFGVEYNISYHNSSFGGWFIRFTPRELATLIVLMAHDQNTNTNTNKLENPTKTIQNSYAHHMAGFTRDHKSKHKGKPYYHTGLLNKLDFDMMCHKVASMCREYLKHVDPFPDKSSWHSANEDQLRR